MKFNRCNDAGMSSGPELLVPIIVLAFLAGFSYNFLNMTHVNIMIISLIVMFVTFASVFVIIYIKREKLFFSFLAYYSVATLLFLFSISSMYFLISILKLMFGLFK